jgi:phosphatidylglycerophosphatase A
VSTVAPPLNPPLQPALRRPDWRFLLSHPAHLIAMGFGCGLSPVAPGTVGTLWAWASFLVLQAWLPPMALAFVVLGSVVVGWWASTVTVDRMRVLDPGAIVVDEIMSFWLVLWVLMPAGWAAQLAAFVVFRLLDAVKPGPVGWADGLFHGFGWRGGLGIIFDDLVAAFCTLFLLAAWRSFA